MTASFFKLKVWEIDSRKKLKLIKSEFFNLRSQLNDFIKSEGLVFSFGLQDCKKGIKYYTLN